MGAVTSGYLFTFPPIIKIQKKIFAKKLKNGAFDHARSGKMRVHLKDVMREIVVGFLHLELDPKKPGKSVKTAIGKCLTE